MNYVVPRFAAIFTDSRMKIPTSHENAADRQHVCAGLRLAAGFIVLVVHHSECTLIPHHRRDALWWDTLRLRTPLLGDALRKAETARFARAMATLVAASVPLVQSIGIARGILNNRRIAGTLEQVSQGVKRGEGIAGPWRGGPVSAAGELIC